MKVLFAVNDENISTSIVKKYQKQYKEIISYKNVYYFNAILKELQRNKNYDRVVISEDLEEFTSTSYEQKDKFIFDRLDNISDEAVSADGNDIPIILICSERRTKSEDILVKLFGIGVYNSIIGEDISIEEVCKLINKPRSKKEAKIYYRIDSENVSYEKEDDKNVSEVEMQNILIHFKKLGKNEEQYAESFQNIVSQYNDEQLKVIVTILPNNVKEVLEETSPEYRKIINANGMQKVNNDKNSNKKTNAKKVKKGTSEKLLELENTKIMSKPVVVPTTLENSMYKKVEPKKKVEIEDLDDEDIMNDIEKILSDVPKKRGRPRKNAVVEEENLENSKVKKRGRPKKAKIEEEEDDILDGVLPGFEEDEDEELSTSNILPGFEDDEEDDEIEQNIKIEDEDDFEDYEDEDEDDFEDSESEEENEDDFEEDIEVNFEDDESEIEEDEEDDDETFDILKKNRANTSISYQEQTQDLTQYDNVFKEGEIESLLTGDKKVVTFVGTSKNGTSFIVNSVAQVLSNMGINTAILDATQNKNAYYIYTKNEENLRKTAVYSMENLIRGNAEGIKVNNNLTVYTTIPSEGEKIKNSRPILETLIRNHSLVLIDCDFKTPAEYFEKSQEIYLVQSMDILTIQPLTEFLRELKIKNALSEDKIRIVLNKILRVKGINGKNIVGGMSNYNDPEMSFMTELFDRNTAKVVGQLPFDEDVYVKYLESLVECEIKTNGYTKEFKMYLNSLAGVIYPLLPNKTSKKSKPEKREFNQHSSTFSAGMNNTLDNMRKKY